MKSARQNLKSGTSLYKIGAFILIVIIIAYGLFHYGYIKKNCEQDRECFYEAAKTCSPAKLINVKNGNYYEYLIKGERGSNCLLYVKLTKVAPGSDVNTKALFEGKDMSCRIPLNELEQTDFAELKGFVGYCHGTLKEAIYEQIVTKMYGLIIQNMEEIISAATEEIS